MNRTILWMAVLSGLAAQNGYGQNSKTATHPNVPTETAGAVCPEQSHKFVGLPMDDTRLLHAWFGAGSAGDGVWFGPRGIYPLYFFADSGKASLAIHPSGKAYFANSIHVNGTTTTNILTVTGGSDIAEPFPMSENDSIPAGAVVVIDEQNPGKLKLCRKAYDSRVAGVVSGAGGVSSGLTLQQEGKFGKGINMALNGRVYALASAANGPIKPGDLLTTSDVAGHAMKATNKELSRGAIFGKALTALETGAGLVLVLVNLQ